MRKGKGRNDKDSRKKYWSKHEKPVRKKRRGTGVEHRLRAGAMSLWSVVADLGSRSDAAVLKLTPAELTNNQVFSEHQQKLRGALTRLLKHDPYRPLPKLVELAIGKAAFVTLDGRGRKQ